LGRQESSRDIPQRYSLEKKNGDKNTTKHKTTGKNREGMDLDRAAKVLREKGNQYYLQDEFEAAIRSYMQALEYCPDDSVLYSNQAVCFLKLGDHDQALMNAERAIQLNKKATKAWFYKGQALEAKGLLQDATAAYEKALVVGREKDNEKKVGKQLQTQIYSCLQRVRQKIRKIEQEQQLKIRSELFNYVKTVIDRYGVTLSGTDEEDHMIKAAQLEHLFSEYEDMKKPKEPPDYFCCKITFDIMMDPVTTPSGISYERSAIEDYLQKHNCDPVTMVPCAINDLRPNLALKEAIEDWLRQNPYYI